jgi:predicted dehydrogenase
MSSPLRIAVIGVGHLGRHHARILAGRAEVTLVGVADVDPARAREVADSVGTRVLEGEISGVDAVVVAVPTELHAQVAVPLLRRGVSALVEKPLARSLDEADALISAARDGGSVLAVGHSERFNPAVMAALPHITRPGFVEVHRLGTPPGRSLDIDVVFDLMIHDLDVLLATVGGEVTSIEAVGVPVLTPRVDIANARLRFASGCIANITASRISRDRVRKVRFFQPHSYVSIDYASQELELWGLRPDGAGAATIEGGKVEIPRGEPLELELMDFIEAVTHRRAPRVSGEDGRRALALAQRITDCMEGRAGSSSEGPALEKLR